MRHFDSSIPSLQLSFLKTVKLARKNFIQLNNPSLCLHSQPNFEQNNHRDWAGKGFNITPKELKVVPLSTLRILPYRYVHPFKSFTSVGPGRWGRLGHNFHHPSVLHYYLIIAGTRHFQFGSRIMVEIIIVITIIFFNSHARQQKCQAYLESRDSRRCMELINYLSHLITVVILLL